MSNSSNYFFASEKASKPSRVWIGVRQGKWHSVLPANALGTWEHVFKKSVLTAQFHVNVTVTEARNTACLMHSVDASYRFFGVILSLKFNIAVHGLGCRALHDDMNGTAVLGSNKARLSTKELGDLQLRNRVRNLGFHISKLVSTVDQAGKTTYIRNFQDTPFWRDLEMSQATNRHLAGQSDFVNALCSFRDQSKALIRVASMTFRFKFFQMVQSQASRTVGQRRHSLRPLGLHGEMGIWS